MMTVPCVNLSMIQFLSDLFYKSLYHCATQPSHESKKEIFLKRRTTEKSDTYQHKTTNNVTMHFNLYFNIVLRSFKYFKLHWNSFYFIL